MTHFLRFLQDNSDRYEDVKYETKENVLIS